MTPTETLRPIGPGNETVIETEFPESEAHYTLVDDVAPDHSIGTLDDVDKVGSTAVYNTYSNPNDLRRDLYDLPPHEVIVGIIDQIEVFVVIRNSNSNVKASIRTGGTTYDSGFFGTGVPPSFSWHEESNVWTTNPDTGNAWLLSEIDTLEIGVLLGGIDGGVSACTQVYVVITYAKLPVVTQPPLTNLLTTTVTGHGVIVNTGQSPVTEHGHCWGTSVDPDTAGSKTTNGAGSAGAFSSSITGLAEGVKYYFRAYATNTDGTGYSSNITYTAGFRSTHLIEFEISVVQTKLMYTDADGKVRGQEFPLI